MPGRGKFARLVVVGAGVLACGDPGDIELPFAPRGATREAAPVFARIPARAFAKLDVVDARSSGDAAGAEGGCPMRFSSSLGQPCAQLDTNDGVCVPVRDGENASVTCSVRPLVLVADAYDVELTVHHEFLPTLAVTGPLNAARQSRVALHVMTPDGTLLDADCSAEALAVQPGSARLRLSRCTTRIDNDDVPDCDIDLLAGLENCAG